MGSGKGKQRRARAVASPGVRATINQVAFDEFIDDQSIGGMRVADYYNMRSSYPVAGLELSRALNKNWMTELAGELFRDLVSIGAIEFHSPIDVGKFVFTVGVSPVNDEDEVLFVSYAGGEEELVLVEPAENFNLTTRMNELTWDVGNMCRAAVEATKYLS